MSDDTLRASFLAEAIPNFWLPRKYLPPRPLPLTKSHISPLSAFLSKLKPSLLACSTASSPATLLHAARPRLSRQVIHTRPPSSSSFHIPHALTAGASATLSTQITDPSMLGNVVISKKFLRTRKIMVMHSNERGEYDLRTLVDHNGSVDTT